MRNGKGEAPETSEKYRKAVTINSKRAETRRSEEQKRRDREEAMRNNPRLKKPHEVKSVPADIKILYEDKFYELLRSLPAQHDGQVVVGQVQRLTYGRKEGDVHTLERRALDVLRRELVAYPPRERLQRLGDGV